ncbi:sporulation protein YqfD [uncultured Thomasclavelia sp.]|uniref:sporulation protein YqfD n=1 Tax=uncultured Thomasclavelia sp. TaxID=3025759 RepID=UPI00260EBCA1|nr:sporulation protein YqfD [uncultured Thomasclavelia sp.]
MKLGYDLYEVVSDDIISLLNSFKKDHLIVFQLTKIDDNTYRFYLPIYQRFLARKYNMQIIKSIGILYYLVVLFCKKINIIGVISFVLTLLICSRFIFKVEITGNSPSNTKLVEEVLKENNINAGDLKKSYQELNEIYDDLKASFKGKIDYLNIYQEGGVLFVKYTNSVGAKEVENNFQNIYASKDGVIQSIDVSSGNIVVQVNQFVKKGDLLVSNTITSTNGENKIIATKGKVMAYTYVTYQGEIDAKKMDEGEAFSYLLYTIRAKLGSIDKIDREKVLSYDIIDNKRVLKMQYVLIEDIAIKEES